MTARLRRRNCTSPQSVALDGAGNLYIADWGNNRIRKVDAAEVITTVAGDGMRGFGGDGGPATAAQLYLPWGVARTAPATCTSPIVQQPHP